ncbi:glycoside hydrolase family 28 protein [Scleroderma citrinum Foug A]|uniref:galacturonan 1,4-alpha-galacturonidase n=1 Tax=Scleroderma citrinum Foug A TaxID=1036808 RepID=A0A0C3E8Q2_9AGAM|nr:glycoside hydrolase family 28 protein [Scleroderma citrinum Foug A]
MCLANILPFLPLALALSPNIQVSGNTCTVAPLGGGKDDGPNIRTAFQMCGSRSTIVLDGTYTIGTVLVTTGLDNVRIKFTGSFNFAPNTTYWTENAYFMGYQNASTFWFLSGQHVHLCGGGTLNGNGQVWWDALANNSAGVAGGSSTTFARPVLLTVGNASHVWIDGIQQVNPPSWNNFIYQSTDVTYTNINISVASRDSNPAKNTDGWDIYRSSRIHITDSIVNNTDDCVAFKPNTTHVKIVNLWCGGSHGISVGSLGQYAGVSDVVEHVHSINVTMINGENGARIKTFAGSADPHSIAGGGSGYVRDVTFQNFQLTNINFPILIDQCYFSSADTCAKYPSQVNISDIHFIDIIGTSSGKEGDLVADLECSAALPCHGITATGTHLVPGTNSTMYYCKSVADVGKLDFDCVPPS